MYPHRRLQIGRPEGLHTHAQDTFMHAHTHTQYIFTHMLACTHIWVPSPHHRLVPGSMHTHLPFVAGFRCHSLSFSMCQVWLVISFWLISITRGHQVSSKRQTVPEMLKCGKHMPLRGDDMCRVHAQEDVDMQTHIHPHTRTDTGR